MRRVDDSIASNRRMPIFDRVLGGLALAFLVLAANFAYSIWGTTELARSMKRLQTREVQLFDEAWQVRYYDEALTHSASQFVLTGGNVEWKSRYERLVVELDTVLNDLRARGDKSVLTPLDEVSKANDALVDLETRIFNDVEARNIESAKATLTGPYVVEKARYSTGLDAFFAAQRKSIDAAIAGSRDQATKLRTAYAAVTALIAMALVALGSVYRRQALVIALRDEEREREFEKQSFDHRLSRTLDMAQTEDQMLAAVRDVLADELAHGPAELLLADSSDAHLRQVLTTDGVEAKPGCAVASPSQCPAIRLGSTLTFDDPQRYDACPHLRERNLSGCRAVCAPVSMTGLTVGVLHAIVATEAADDEEMVHARRIAERVGARAGERIGILRAFQQTQLQASTDPLTGLMNRRSLEARASELLRSGASISVLYLDLDHFKMINDTHGHDTGDRSLRQFSKVLRDSTRSADLVGRWGGEEFVIVVADNMVQTVQSLFERIQESLVVASAIGQTPALTTSGGAAQSDVACSFADVLARADRALLLAKQQGRNRLVMSSEDARPSGLPESANSSSSSHED
jgi:diguanylate cyclase (GGDEF)-like protein